MTGQNNWVAFTGDKGIASVNTQRKAIENYKARVFFITNPQATGEQKAQQFLNNLEEIAQACLKPPPGCWRVKHDGLERVLPVKDQNTHSSINRQRDLLSSMK